MSPAIVLLPGDGIGPEIVGAARRVLDAVGEFDYTEHLIGGASIDAHGTALTDEVLDACRGADAVLLGAVGGPRWDTTDPDQPRPEQGLLGLRKGLGLYANLRPVRPIEALLDASPLRRERIAGTDLVVVRELTGGIYFGEKTRTETSASDTCVYTVEEIERIARVAFEAARGRRRHVTSVDKANVLETSRLWRATVGAIAPDYPDVELDHLLVDNAAMQLVSDPTRFDVLVTENMFGDILSDESAMLTGSLGMLPSASLGGGRPRAVRAGARHGPRHRGIRRREPPGDPALRGDAPPRRARDAGGGEPGGAGGRCRPRRRPSHRRSRHGRPGRGRGGHDGDDRRRARPPHGFGRLSPRPGRS